jgi:hypothetical protein
MTTIDLINGYYTAVLNRPASNAEATAWANLVDSGAVSLDQVQAELAGSNEALSNVVPIIEMFQVELGRVPDQSELAQLVSAEDSGALTLSQIGLAIAGSPESRTFYGSTVDSAFITNLYQNALGRAPEPGAVNFWLAEAQGGMTQAQMEETFRAYPEAMAHAAAAANAFLISAAQGDPNVYVGSLYKTPPGRTFTLTPSADLGAAFTGGAGNDSFNGDEIATFDNLNVMTWTPGDAIDGGGGVNTLNVTQVDTINNPLGTTVSNIQTANMLTSNDVHLDTTAWTGLTALNITGSDGVDFIDAATSTAVSLVDIGSAAQTTIIGGSSVNATVNNSISVSGETGSVTINDSLMNGTPTVAVTGGTTVAITEGGGSVSAGVFTTQQTDTSVGVAPTLATNPNTGAQSISNLAADPTGNVSVSNATAFIDPNGVSQIGYGIGDVDVFTNGATSVSLTGGSHALGSLITDVQTTLRRPASNVTAVPGTSTLSAVSLDGFSGAISITSGVLANLTIADSQSGGVGGQTAKTVATVIAMPALGLTLNNDAVGTSVVDAAATSITIGTAGSAADEIAFTANAATTLTFNNAAAVTLDSSSSLHALTTITDNASGTLTLNATGDTALTAINASSATGAVFAIISATQGFTGGSGDDAVFISAQPTRALVGGAGSNTLVVTVASDGVFANPIANTTGFQTLAVVGTASGTYDAAGFTALTIGQVSGDITFTGVAAGTTLAIVAAPTQQVSYVLANSSGPADSLSVTLGVDGSTSGIDATSMNSKSLTAANVETLNVASVGSGTGANSIKFNDAAATSVVITGDEALFLLGVVGASVTTINASGSSGAINETSASGNYAALGVAITGGSGLLTAQGGSSASESDTVTSGSGGLNYVLGSGATGSQTIDLRNATNVASTISITNDVAQTVVIRGFKTSALVGDTLTFSVPKTVIDNVVSAATLSGGTYTAFNGMISFGGTESASLPTQISDAQVIVAAGGRDRIGAFVFGGNTYLVKSDDVGISSVFAAPFNAGQQNTGGALLATTFASSFANFTVNDGITIHVYDHTAATVNVSVGLTAADLVSATSLAARLNAAIQTVSSTVSITASGNALQVADSWVFGSGIQFFDNQASSASVIELAGVTTATGFGTVAAADTILSSNVSNASNTLITASASHSQDDTNYALQNIAAAGATVFTETVTNLASSATVTVAGDGTFNLTTTQLGTPGSETLTLNTFGTDTITTARETGDGTLTLNASATTVIGNLVDAGGTNQLATIVVAGAGTTTISAIADTALTTIDARPATGSVTLGAPGPGLSQSGLLIENGTGSMTLYASGANDTVTSAATTGSVSLNLGGSGATVTLAAGASNNVVLGTHGALTVDSVSVAATTTGSTVPSAVITGLNTAALDTITFQGDTVVPLGNPGITAGPITAYTTLQLNALGAALLTGNPASLASAITDVFSIASGGGALAQHRIAEFQLNANSYFVEQAHAAGTAFSSGDTLVELTGSQVFTATSTVSAGVANTNGGVLHLLG